MPLMGATVSVLDAANGCNGGERSADATAGHGAAGLACFVRTWLDA